MTDTTPRLPRALSPSPRARKSPRSQHSSAPGIDVADFRSLCIGSPVPTVTSHSFDPSDAVSADDPPTLDYSNHQQSKLLQNSPRGSSPMCPAITVDKTSSKNSISPRNNSQSDSLSLSDYNAESGAISPISPIICPTSPIPGDGLAPRSPLQRRAANNSKYVTYHRADLAQSMGKKDHQRGSSVTETTEALRISTTAASKGHTRADTYPPKDDKLRSLQNKPGDLNDIISLSAAPSLSSKNNTDFSSSPVGSPDGNSFIGKEIGSSGSNQYRDYHRKKALPAKLAPLNCKPPPNLP